MWREDSKRADGSSSRFKGAYTVGVEGHEGTGGKLCCSTNIVKPDASRTRERIQC